MDSVHSLLENYGLHRYALLGDDEGVRRSLREGADINALDNAGRTGIMCAVAGEHWQNVDAYDASFMTPKRLNALKLLVNHPDTSLLTLNTPQTSMNGVIPLGMAAWLNQPQAVRVLLEESVDSVSVDGMDSHGATALMYAARDGSLEVVQALLSRGARPDFRDRNHRTAIQFSLSHPQILWLCETVLRRHRWRESKSADRTRLSLDTERLVELAYSSMPCSEDLEPPPQSIFTKQATSRLTDTLVSSIRSSDLTFFDSLLFSPAVQASSPPALYPMSVPVLVNLPDSNGWSLVHHCAAADRPSIEILDALYCAGADVSLFTTHEQQTSLHILARTAHSFSGQPDSQHSLQQFVLHLVQDLRAPLSAQDKDDETCIHIAAEHGHSIDLLMLFLDCDSSGTVRERKNSRGLTPFEVAKKEFLHAFGLDKRSPSALSNYTIRPTDSFTSLTSVSELNSFYLGLSNDASSICSSSDFDVGTAVQQLLTGLRATSLSIQHSNRPAHIEYLENCLEEASDQCDSIVVHFRGRIEEATKAVKDLQKNADRISSVRNVVGLATRGKLALKGITPLHTKRRQRDSEDSEMTVVHADEESPSQPPTPSFSNPDDSNHLSTGTQTALLDLFLASRAMSTSNSPWTDIFIQSPESASYRGYFASLWDVECELSQLQQQTTNSSPTESLAKATLKLKQVLKKKKKLEDKLQELELDRKEKKDSLSGASRVKAWLKRMVIPQHSSQKLEIVHDIDEQNCNVGHEVKRSKPPSTKYGDVLDRSIDDALRTSQVVLENARRDLLSINECIASAEQFIDMANHSISRTQRVVKRAIKKREAMIADLHATAANQSQLAAEDAFSPGLLGYTSAITSRPSLASISTIYSTSSVLSVAATLTENDDEDIRIIRRLLLRKIEAQASGAWDEVDKVMGWLQIVKEAVRSVKRRAYL
ncbi:hypothetical protein GALMADRAFT_63953 [Galerina marginata CBS 339.88]|uniref:Ankyrin n=1 Tax=Galerina marginata (strain CBS 339.88) TaxID=685588 RepID=A0A067TFX5_GALM3|nr:hypothetical protein GALMADRAFT_63953 [Galerina marginata CBS 339.88]